MKAEFIAIGTELLLGEIADTNTCVIARALRDIGVNLFRTTTIGDNPERITHTIRESVHRAQVIITTGGLGPTVDDPTRAAVASALDIPLEFRPDLWIGIQRYFNCLGRTAMSNNRRQAYLPQGAIPIPNAVGTAPGFIAETDQAVVISLPGVPAEMRVLLVQSVLPYLQSKLKLHEIIKSRIIRTAGIGESIIDNRIDDLEHLDNPTVGLAAHAGCVDIRIAAKADSEDQAESMLDKIEKLLRERLGDKIYGVNDESLKKTAIDAVTKRDWHLAVIESGTSGALAAALSTDPDSFSGGIILREGLSLEQLDTNLGKFKAIFAADVWIGIVLNHSKKDYELGIILQSLDGTLRQDSSFGGPPESANHRAANIALDFLRRKI